MNRAHYSSLKLKQTAFPPISCVHSVHLLFSQSYCQHNGHSNGRQQSKDEQTTQASPGSLLESFRRYKVSHTCLNVRLGLSDLYI